LTKERVPLFFLFTPPLFHLCSTLV
jgi:hypothetical protein